MSTRNMPASTVVELLKQFQAAGIHVWIDGGWAVDALLGEKTRPHGDLDIVVEEPNVEHTRLLLRSHGYMDQVDDDTRPWNFVMGDEAGHEVDFHVIVFDSCGHGAYGPPDLGLAYPADSLTGHGIISKLPVSCISPEWLVRFHVGYEPDEQDVQDVMALHERFEVPLPEEYVAFTANATDSHDRAQQQAEQLVELAPMALPESAKVIFGAALYRPTPEKIDATLESVYAAPETRLFGLAADEQIVAVVGIRLYGGSVAAEVLHIAVAEPHRQRGYGRRMMDLVAGMGGFTELYAETDRDAVGFYERCGFSVESLGEKYPGVERFLCKWVKSGDEQS